MHASLGLIPAFAVWFLLTASPPLAPASSQASAPGAVDTTVVDSVEAGQVAIQLLPSHLAGQPILRYRAVRVPATGWLWDRSFFWSTPKDAEGNYRFAFRAELPSGDAESVVLRVFVSPADPK